MDDVFILGGARTPMAEYTGKLKDLSEELRREWKYAPLHRFLNE